MAVELTRKEYVQIQIVRILRKIVRSCLVGEEVSSTFYVRDVNYNTQLPDVLIKFGVREMESAGWPTKNAFRKEIHSKLSDISSLYTFRVEFVLGSEVIFTEYGECVPVNEILIVNDEFGTILFRYNPSEYLHLLRHLEGDNEGQNIHLLNAIKYNSKR